MARRCLVAWALAVALGLSGSGDALSLRQQHAGKPAAAHETHEVGEKIEVLMELGNKGAWVPAVISRNRFKGVYEASVAIGPKDRYETMVTLGDNNFRRNRNKTSWEQWKHHYADHPVDAKKTLQLLEREDARRMRASLRKTGMNASMVQAKFASMQRSMKAKKEQAMREHGCPRGYEAVDGDARGGDQFGRGMTNRQDTLDLCAEECSAEHSCLSFEWSISTKICNLNKVVAPDKFPHFGDYIFCQQTSPAATAILTELAKNSTLAKRTRPRSRAAAAKPSAASNSSAESRAAEPRVAVAPSAAAKPSVATGEASAAR